MILSMLVTIHVNDAEVTKLSNKRVKAGTQPTNAKELAENTISDALKNVWWVDSALVTPIMDYSEVDIDKVDIDKVVKCPHGNLPHECDDCDRLSDFAFDAHREGK